ncbi:hypothetical protein HOF92_12755 [bacterium]|jgi:adenylate cyclase|nr:hypothetical protein [bacterium]
MIQAIFEFGIRESDLEEEKRKKKFLFFFGLILVLVLPMDVFAILYSGDHFVGGALFTNWALTFLGFFHFVFWKTRSFFQNSQFLLIILITALAHVFMGDFKNIGAMMIWGAMTPLGAAFLSSKRAYQIWTLAYICTVVLLVLFNPQISSLRDGLPHEVNIYFDMVCVLGFPLIILPLIYYYLGQLDKVRIQLVDKNKELNAEKQKSEKLLLNILPEPVANRLNNGENTIADRFSEVSVLFADLVGFTQLSSQTDPRELVELLNQIFSRFDEAAQSLEIEKIKTIGDAYMAASGLPVHKDQHAHVLARFALKMQKILTEFNQEVGNDLSIRVGINSGPAVAGVIGHHRFIYDLWGDVFCN